MQQSATKQVELTAVSRFAHKRAFFQKSWLVMVCLPLLSACVGSSVGNTLESAANEAPTSLMASEDTVSTDLSYATVSAIPVPVRSPKTAELSIVPDLTQTPVETAAINAVEPNNQTGLEQPAQNDSVLALADGQSSGQSLQTPVNPQPVTPLSSDTTLQADTTIGQAPTSAPAKPAQPVAKKPVGLFAALFGGNRQNKNPAPQATPRKTVPSQTATLPGVKRNSAIFGINDDKTSKPEIDTSAGVQVASVGTLGGLRTVNGLVLQTERVQVDCFKPELMRILRIVERRYGQKVVVTSGYRSPKGNRRAGGVRNSTHIYCKAADIQVKGVSKWDLAKFLRTVEGRGGVGTYCRTKSVHIDVGSVRDWHHPCRRSKSRKKKRA